MTESSTNLTTSQVLEEALKLFGKNGEHWVNHCPIGEREYCVVTACSSVSKGWNIPTRLLRKATGETGAMHYWNDAPERTFPEVREAFLKAIELAKAEESHV